MSAHYRDLLFTPRVLEAQAALGSRGAYAQADAPGTGPDRLGDAEAGFIAARDSFYMATTSASGWPYMQHRGGARGFVKVLSDRTFGFADFRGNRQYLSLGNLAEDDRAAFFFMDYPRRARLKLLGRVRAVALGEDTALAAALVDPGYRGAPERGLVVEVEAFDWNCAQHITPRFTAEEIAPGVAKLEARIRELEAELAARRT